MTPRKLKRQDDTAARPHQPAHAPVAEAIAFGAAAGGLVLGTMQAQGAVPDGRDVIPMDRAADAPPESHEQAAQPRAQDIAPEIDAVASQLVPARTAVTEPGAPQAQAEQRGDSHEPVGEPAPAEPQMLGAADLVALAGMEVGTIPSSIPALVQNQLVSELSEQMTATLVKVIGNAEPGLSPADMGQSIAADIIASAQQIASNLDIETLLAQTQDLGDAIVAQVDAPGIAAEVLDATSGITNSVLSEVSDLPASILGATSTAMADLPSSLLGNDGPDGSGGFLSETFYADGASDGLAIPALSDVASTLVADIGNATTGLLGLSYVDMADHQGGHGLNALSLL